MAFTLHKLTKTDEYKFNEFINDWRKLPTIYMDFPALETYDGDFAKFLKHLDDLSKETYPQDYYFLMGDTTIYGFVVIRPKLNDYFKDHGGNILYGVPPRLRNQGYGSTCLREGIALCASKYKLKKILLTCHKLNVTAARVTMNNAGVQDPEGEITLSNGDKVRKFWVTLK